MHVFHLGFGKDWVGARMCDMLEEGRFGAAGSVGSVQSDKLLKEQFCEMKWWCDKHGRECPPL
eukprot:9917752-Alexandrium_andersonii.AAC.1